MDQRLKLTVTAAGLTVVTLLSLAVRGDYTDLGLRLLGVLVLPGFIGLGWRYMVEGEADPAIFLTRYSITVTALFTALSLIRLDPLHLNFGTVLLVLTSTLLLLVYLRGLHYTRIGGIVATTLLVLYVCAGYLLLLESIDAGSRWAENTALSTFLFDLAFTGVFLSLTPHIFLLDLIQKLREGEEVEKMLEASGSDEESFKFLKKSRTRSRKDHE